MTAIDTAVRDQTCMVTPEVTPVKQFLGGLSDLKRCCGGSAGGRFAVRLAGSVEAQTAVSLGQDPFPRDSIRLVTACCAEPSRRSGLTGMRTWPNRSYAKPLRILVPIRRAKGARGRILLQNIGLRIC
jgi:hypothetical protein